MLNREVPRIAVLASHRAPGVLQLLTDPARARNFELVVCVTSEAQMEGRNRIEAAGVPVVSLPIRQFHRDRGLPIRNLKARREYDQALAEILGGFDVDLVFLTSYLYILSEPMLSAYSGRIINIHDSDLTILDQERRRRYVGLHSTREAIANGEPETRASVHLVTSQVDEGPLILVSDSFPVPPFLSDGLRWEAWDMIKAYAFAHREWVFRAAWGPLLRRTIDMIVSGEIHFVGETAWFNGMPGPCQMNGVPECRQPAPPPACPFLHQHKTGARL